MKIPAPDEPGRPIANINPDAACRWQGNHTRFKLLRDNGKGAVVCTVCDAPGGEDDKLVRLITDGADA